MLRTYIHSFHARSQETSLLLDLAVNNVILRGNLKLGKTSPRDQNFSELSVLLGIVAVPCGKLDDVFDIISASNMILAT